MKINWNFLVGGRGGGVKNKKPSMGGVWVFSGTVHWQEHMAGFDCKILCYNLTHLVLCKSKINYHLFLSRMLILSWHFIICCNVMKTAVTVTSVMRECKQNAHYRSNEFVTIFIVLTLDCHWPPWKVFSWEALVRVAALWGNSRCGSLQIESNSQLCRDIGLKPISYLEHWNTTLTFIFNWYLQT